MTVLVNQTRQRLSEGRIAASFNVSRIQSVEVAGIARSCGFHWLFIDLEHSAMDLTRASEISLACLHAGITPIVRVPENDVSRAQRMLDNGAQGVIFPHVETVEQARELVRACRYPPDGNRSLAAGGPQHGYAKIPASELMPILNAETLLVVMLETPEAANRAGEIASIPGIDIVMVGSNDLSAAMGKTGEFTNPIFSDLVGQVIDDVKAGGKVTGLGGIYDETLLTPYLKRGVRFVLGGTDLSFMLPGARARASFFNNFEVDRV